MKFMPHPFHIVTISPWPLITSISLLNLMFSIINMFNFNNFLWFYLSLISTSLCLYQWWRDVIRESSYQGIHTKSLIIHMNKGMILFITSEVMFFVSFFWAYFHMMLAPSMEIGMMWPPKSIIIFNPFNIPLLNTIILLTSGMFITWAHFSILNKNFKTSKISMLVTIILGMTFTFFQYMEYSVSMYSINDSSFSSTFFVTTGFHGIHVIIGSLFIMFSFIRLMNNHFSKNHHFGFEASAWYWHFVDVVWLFLYLFMYWWPY
uniref:cytochrome c oxidase subunit III n=1 Tax=Platygaster robiniae TaxID=2753657 RepID=UPI002115C579|nr:cytochrome c oxidase subunit III [Platygaster robiniae]UTI38869.1 cytochrome c oxidase subunit III [Platygaster robiniae]